MGLRSSLPVLSSETNTGAALTQVLLTLKDTAAPWISYLGSLALCLHLFHHRKSI